ncbi:hypothetical protein TTRE_0000035301 [Trichuris trichiura]|uniref:Spaetzle domain-containing protein n=1 Tax=Trichuris trichiura TaxID=36087 RepID=A0A077YWJ0_TRITR|nr:hypothetical protein TTRE_0000035301 [Trichuris trichiura]
MEYRTRLLVYFVLTNLDFFPYSCISWLSDAQKYPEHRPAGLNYHWRAVELMPVVETTDGYKKDAEQRSTQKEEEKSEQERWIGKRNATAKYPDDDFSYQRHHHDERYFRKQTSDTANSVTELLLNFRDPITNYPIVPDFSLNSYGNEAKVACSTKRCLGCMQKLFDKLKDAQSIHDKTHREMRFLSRELHLDRIDYRSYCKHFDAKASDFFDCKPSFLSEEDVRKVNSHLRGDMLTCPVHNGKKMPKPTYGNLHDVDQNRKWLRISYSMDRPSGKTVQGYGTCRPRYRHISVWYSNRTTDMQNAVVYVPVACECQVPYSSILRNLIVGTANSVSVLT